MALELYRSGPYSFRCQSVTDVGLVRRNNEDTLILAPEIGLLGVCDGLGGHASGEVASEIASKTLAELLASGLLEPETALSNGLRTANERILKEQADHPQHRGMGTTLSALWLVPNGSGQAWIVHIGDSRVYRLRQGRLSQITEDHSPVFRLHKQGVLTKDQMLEHPQKNLLDRSLGILPTVEPDIFRTDLRTGDRVLICTDGLTDYLKDGEIERILAGNSIEQATQELVAAAKAKGGFDNITLAILDVVEVACNSNSPHPTPN